MIRRTWRLLAPLARRPQLTLVAIALVSATSGLAESLVLVCVVQATLSLANSDTASSESIPFLDRQLTDSSLLMVAGVLGLVALVLHAVLAHLGARLSSDVLWQARKKAITAYLQSGWSRQSQEREGALQETTSGLAVQSSQLALAFANVLTSSLSLAALLATAAIVDLWSTVVVVLCGALLFAALRPIGNLTRSRARRYVAANNEFAEEISRAATLAMEVKVFGAEPAVEDRLGALGRRAAVEQRRTRFASRMGSTLYRDIAALLMVGAVAGLHSASIDQIGGIGTVLVLLVRSLSSAQGVHGSLQQVSEFAPHLENLDRRLRGLSADRVSFGTRPLRRLDRMAISNVDYSYVPGRPVLKDISLEVEPGEMIGLVGPSGSGKSTLVEVLLRLRTPTAGTIEVDGRPYEEYAVEDWTRLTSFVPQESRLTQDTVASNIRFMRGHVTVDEAKVAARQANIASVIDGLEDGYETDLGPRGAGLSGGQRQRLSIARALAGEPDLLVLDEPTSALDAHAEEAIKAAIAELKGSVTMLVVAHRLSTLEECDRIVVMRDGTIEAVGSPRALSARSGLFQGAWSGASGSTSDGVAAGPDGSPR